MMRVGIIALLQESNTFIDGETTRQHFEEDMLARGEAVRERLADAAHEVGGFFEGLAEAGIEAVPVFAARAYPFGVIQAEVFAALVAEMLEALRQAGPLDGVLAAPHGATVAENHPDADGWWLRQVRALIGPRVPLIATLDPHTNLSEDMVAATDALLAYRSNPHLDQRETGLCAARLMARTLRGEARPTQAAAFPPLAINIQCQNTSQPPLREFYEWARMLEADTQILSQSTLLGFPYADVVEMGSSVVVVTDGDAELARRLADGLAADLWERRQSFLPVFTPPEQAVEQAAAAAGRVLLLDMGDNVGGGSPGHGTILLWQLHRRGLGPAFVCLHDPASAAAARAAGAGARLTLRLGGEADGLHGEPLEDECEVVSLHDGRFHDLAASHGGFKDFDQGPTAVVRTSRGNTVMLTTRRMPPFSLQQLRSCGVDPLAFHILVAKGVIAPQAAYGPVVDHLIHVNTPGVTCADMTQLPFHYRRRPMFPFEPHTTWPEPAGGFGNSLQGGGGGDTGPVHSANRPLLCPIT